MLDLKLHYPRRAAQTSWEKKKPTEKAEPIINCPDIWPGAYNRYWKYPCMVTLSPLRYEPIRSVQISHTISSTNPGEGDLTTTGKTLTGFEGSLQASLLVTSLLVRLTPACWLFLQNKCFLYVDIIWVWGLQEFWTLPVICQEQT